MEIFYSPKFVRMLKALIPSLQNDAIEKIQLFQDVKNHHALKVHKLRGRLKDQYSFSVNYQIRITFIYIPSKPKEAYLLTVGDHDIYD